MDFYRGELSWQGNVIGQLSSCSAGLLCHRRDGSSMGTPWGQHPVGCFPSVSKVKEIQQKALHLTASLWLQQVTGTGYQQNWDGCFRSWMGFEPPDQTHKTPSKTFGCVHCRCSSIHGMYSVILSSTAPENSLSPPVTSLYPP